jgi:hypothetical protein
VERGGKSSAVERENMKAKSPSRRDVPEREKLLAVVIADIGIRWKDPRLRDHLIDRAADIASRM